MPVNEIKPFGVGGTVADGDVMSLSDYEIDPQRVAGNQAGIARRDLVNTVLRQAMHMSAGLAQFVANRYTAGVVDDGDLDKVEAGLLVAINEIIADSFQNLSDYLRLEDIGSSVQPYDAATAKTNVAQAWVPVQAYRPATLTSSDGVAIWNLIWQPVAELTMTEDVILTLSAASVGSTVILRVTQDATGGWSLIWPSTIKWMGGVVPDLTSAPGAIDMIQLDIGSNGTRYGQVVKDYKVAS